MRADRTKIWDSVGLQERFTELVGSCMKRGDLLRLLSLNADDLVILSVRRGSRGGWSRRTPPLWLREKKKKKKKKETHYGSLNVAFYVILWIDVPQLTMPKCNNFIIRLLKL